jgi:hypothetical protein
MDLTPPDARTAEPSWPALSASDLRRLSFFAYLRRTGRLRPPSPIGPEVDALCTALLREPPAPRVTVGGRRNAHHGGLPPLWQAYAERQKWRGAQAQ